MYKITIFIIIAVFFFLPVNPENNMPSDLSKFQNGGKISSPAGAYRSGGSTPSPAFTGFLSKLGIFLKKNSQLIIDIRGHSDDQGTDRINKNISGRRAEFVKGVFLKNSGIKSDRIISRGYSDNLPVKSNKTEAGRMVNRRVEIFLTNNKNPVGEITFIKNSVFTKPPEDNDYKKAKIFENLFNLYKLNTKKRSGANIKLSDESRLNIGPESLMVIYEMIESELSNPDAWKDKKVKLLTGFLRTKLNDLRRGIKIETPQCEIDSRSKIMLVDISEKKQSSVSVFEGISDVKAQDKTVNVQSGFGTFVEEGKKPSKPEPLPDAPQISSPEAGTMFSNKGFSKKEVKIDLKWNSSEDLTHLQISEDKEFTKIVADKKVSGSSFSVSLKGGNYTWRVAGINNNGIEGFPAISNFSVNIIKGELIVETTPKSMGTPLEAHGSTSIVKNNLIMITGRTIPGAKVSISYEKVEVDESGKFSKEISLGRGWNIIKVEAVHPDYRTKKRWISVCYFKKYRK